MHKEPASFQRDSSCPRGSPSPWTLPVWCIPSMTGFFPDCPPTFCPFRSRAQLMIIGQPSGFP